LEHVQVEAVKVVQGRYSTGTTRNAVWQPITLTQATNVKK